MNRKEIWADFEANGGLRETASRALRAMLRTEDDVYDAISLAGDAAATHLAGDIATHLNSDDDMVRWISAVVLFSRFREVRFAPLCLDLLQREQDTVVRGGLLEGAGELLPLCKDNDLRESLARELRRVLEDPSEFQEMRDSAYYGVQAAVGISPPERSTSRRRDASVVETFIRIYGLEGCSSAP